MKPAVPAACLLLAVLPLAQGCVTRILEQTAHEPQPFVRRASPERAWQVVEGDTPLGVVILFESAGDPPIYLVQNAWQQDLGMIDSLGRAWRYLPHASEADWLGTGTVLEGARLILGAAGECSLREIEVPVAGAGD